MPAPLIDDVRPLLAKREAIIVPVVLGAWDQWWRRTPGRTKLFRRTRACLIHNYMTNSAPTAFAPDRGIHVIEGQETLFFLVEDRLLFRFKKGDEQGISANVDTQASLAFNNPQQMLIDLPDVARVDIAYVLNRFETTIDRILVVARDGDRAVWSYAIHPRADETEFPTPLPVQPATPPAAADTVVRLPVGMSRKEEKRDN